MAKYELALFDFDGTLADTLPWFQSVFHVVGEKHGLRRLDPAEQEKLRDSDSKALLKALNAPFWKVPLLVRDMRVLMAQHIQEAKLFPETRDLLKTLRAKGVSLGIVSSNSEENIRSVLGAEAASQIHFFECGVSMFGKPSRLKKLLRKSGLAPAQAIYIGDEFRDLEAARTVGMAFGAVSWGYNRAEALKKRGPDELFLSMQEMAERLS